MIFINKQLIFLIIAIFFFNGNIFAQNKEIGVDIGYGISDINYTIEPSNYFQIGLNFYSHPQKAPFTIKTGLTYNFKGNKNINFNFLKVPIGLDIIFGKKLNFILGGGFYVSYLLWYKGGEKVFNFEESKLRLQLVGEANIGFAYQISEKIKVCLMCQFNNDITRLYDYPGPCFSGENVKVIDGFCKLGIRYSINKK